MPRVPEFKINRFTEPIKKSVANTLFATERYLVDVGLLDSRPNIAVYIHDQGVDIVEAQTKIDKFASVVDAASDIGRKRFMAATFGVIFASGGLGSGMNDLQWLIFTASQSGFDTPSEYFNLTRIFPLFVKVCADAGALWAGARAMQRLGINNQKLELLRQSEQDKFKYNG